EAPSDFLSSPIDTARGELVKSIDGESWSSERAGDSPVSRGGDASSNVEPAETGSPRIDARSTPRERAKIAGPGRPSAGPVAAAASRQAGTGSPRAGWARATPPAEPAARAMAIE